MRWENGKFVDEPTGDPEKDLLIIFRKHMSNDVEDNIYVPQDFIKSFFPRSSYPILKRLVKKYQIVVEDVVGVKHWVMNPNVIIVSEVQILSLIRQVCGMYDKLKDMPGERYNWIADPTNDDDDDIPF